MFCHICKSCVLGIIKNAKIFNVSVTNYSKKGFLPLLNRRQAFTCIKGNIVIPLPNSVLYARGNLTSQVDGPFSTTSFFKRSMNCSIIHEELSIYSNSSVIINFKPPMRHFLDIVQTVSCGIIIGWIIRTAAIIIPSFLHVDDSHRTRRIFWNLVHQIHPVDISLKFFSDVFFMRLPCQHRVLVDKMREFMSQDGSNIRRDFQISL